MTRLLVSVRDVAEARVALAAGVDLLDLKEPTRGALGAVDAATVQEVVEFVAGRIPVSVALGELVDHATDSSSSLAISRGVTYFKLGLAGCATQPDWIARWQTVIHAAPTGAAPVAVIYADGAAVAAPSAEQILDAAARVECRTVLVDTAIKNGRGLLDHWPPSTLQAFLREARSRRLTTVVGGALTTDTIPTVADCGPDYIAVRGAACEGPRTGTLSAERLAAVKASLSASALGLTT